jgi:hypothetical protein
MWLDEFREVNRVYGDCAIRCRPQASGVVEECVAESDALPLGFELIEDSPDYAVDMWGNVISRKLPGNSKRGVRRWSLKRQRLRDGYPFVSLSLADGKRNVPVHQLVAKAFLGPRPSGHEVAHTDGIKTHNCVWNIRWATHQENIEDRGRHGTTQKGERHGLAALNPLKVRVMRHLFREGFTNREVAVLFHVAPSTVASVHRGETWKHV